MDLTTQRFTASHFGPPWTLPVGPLLSSLVVGNDGSQWSLAELYLALGSLAWRDCGKAWKSGGGFDVIKDPGWSEVGGAGVWNVGSSPLSNDPLSAGNCCLGLCSSLCAIQEPAVMIKVVLNLAIP